MAGRVEYRAGDEFDAPHGRFELTVDADGAVALEHRVSGITRHWSGRVEAVVWPRLLDAVRRSRFADLARPGPAAAWAPQLRVSGAEPAGAGWMRWGDADRVGLTGALRILDALVHQTSDGALDNPGARASAVTHGLPWVTRRVRARPEPVPVVPVGAFGTFGGTPVGGVVRADGGVSVLAVPSGDPVAELPPTGVPPRCVAFGRVGETDVIVTGGDDGVLRVWPGDGRPSRVQTRHAAPVSAITTTASVDGAAVTVWSADLSGRLIERSLAPDAGPPPAWPVDPGAGITALAWAGRWLVTGHDDGRVGLFPLGDPPDRPRPPGDPPQARYWPAHDGWVNAVAVLGADDGLLIASGGADRAIRVIADDGDRTLTGHTESVTGLAFGLIDGRAVLGSCALDGTARTWDAETGAVLAQWSTGDDWPAALADASTAGTQRWAVGGADGAVRVWDAATGTPVWTLTAGTPAAVLAVASALLPGRTLIAAGYADGTLAVWDGATGRPVGVDRSSPEPLTSVEFGSDGPSDVFVCGTAAGSVRVYDPATVTFRSVLTPHTDQVLAVAVADPLIVSGGADRTVRVWDAATGRPLHCLTGHRDLVTVVAVEDRLIASGSYDCTVRIWDRRRGTALVLDGLASPVYALALGRAGGRMLLAAAGFNDSVRVWDAASGAPVLTTRPVDGMVRGLEIGGDVLVALAGDGAVHSWRLPQGAPLATVRAEPSALAIAGDAVLGTGGVTTVDRPDRSE